VFDTAEAEIECMSIFLAKGAMEDWFGNMEFQKCEKHPCHEKSLGHHPKKQQA